MAESGRTVAHVTEIRTRGQEDFDAVEVAVVRGFDQRCRAELVRLLDVQADVDKPAQDVRVMIVDWVVQWRLVAASLSVNVGAVVTKQLALHEVASLKCDEPGRSAPPIGFFERSAFA